MLIKMKTMTNHDDNNDDDDDEGDDGNVLEMFLYTDSPYLLTACALREVV